MIKIDLFLEIVHITFKLVTRLMYYLSEVGVVFGCVFDDECNQWVTDGATNHVVILL